MFWQNYFISGKHDRACIWQRRNISSMRHELKQIQTTLRFISNLKLHVHVPLLDIDSLSLFMTHTWSTYHEWKQQKYVPDQHMGKDLKNLKFQLIWWGSVYSVSRCIHIFVAYTSVITFFHSVGSLSTTMSGVFFVGIKKKSNRLLVNKENN